MLRQADQRDDNKFYKLFQRMERAYIRSNVHLSGSYLEFQSGASRDSAGEETGDKSTNLNLNAGDKLRNCSGERSTDGIVQKRINLNLNRTPGPMYFDMIQLPSYWILIPAL